jgi:hypothetical protein
MFRRTAAVSTLILLVVSSSTILPGQQKPATPAASGTPEFPVVLQQSVTAGKTPVGTEIQAKLGVATLLDGVVIPRDAVFSGEVIASSAKTATAPSRLAIRVHSVQWKKGSTAVTAYLTAWYYPTMDTAGQDLQYGPDQAPKKTWNGLGQYPDTTTKVYKPFPGSDTDKAGSVPDTPSSVSSNRRAVMKDVQSVKDNDGALALVCKRNNIKLDRLTTYVLANSDLMPIK